MECKCLLLCCCIVETLNGRQLNGAERCNLWLIVACIALMVDGQSVYCLIWHKIEIGAFFFLFAGEKAKKFVWRKCDIHVGYTQWSRIRAFIFMRFLFYLEWILLNRDLVSAWRRHGLRSILLWMQMRWLVQRVLGVFEDRVWLSHACRKILLSHIKPSAMGYGVSSKG